MKRRITLLIFFSYLITAFIYASSIEAGVSRQLARQRKECVSDIAYNLTFVIDTARNKNPEGKINIQFKYHDDGKPLQIDFEGEKILSLKVNETEVSSPEWRNGHIIIDNAHLKEGNNSIGIGFIAEGRALNRNPEYMYTLFVPNRAHSVFPCFDQPDMKASYNLTLSVPEGWKAVSNSPVVAASNDSVSRQKTIEFYPTEPLSTYLFAFAAGEFQYRQHTRDGRTIGAFYRETDPQRLAQLDEIFSQVHSSLKQLEDYTGIPYPFAKYDLVILPGFQFGGMEHTGATFYNDNTLFLSKSATAADKLSRAKLIAHETSHMWFGDYVTMEWFDDVWTKEVFANFFAARLVRALLPEFDHDLEWLRVYMAAALDQDRGEGSTPIRQQLDNLKNAGLIYNNIIYNKSPLMMGKLAEITGEENFRLGIRKYLSDHAFGNATWDDLISALSSYTGEDIEQFSRVWVYEAGMPRITFSVEDGKLIAEQTDSRGRGIIWPQSFDVLVSDGENREIISISFEGNNDKINRELPFITSSPLIIPTADGRAYGLLSMENDKLLEIMEDFLNPDGIIATIPPVARLATLMMLNENYLIDKISTESWLNFLLKSIETSNDNQMLSALTRYVGSALLDLPGSEATEFEMRLSGLSQTHNSDQAKTLILKTLISTARSPRSIEMVNGLWNKGESPLLGKDDFTDMALQLALAMPLKADSILSIQRSRIEDADRLRKFDFISRAAVSDPQKLDSLFNSLSDPSNRLVEPWTLSLLSLLNHPSRHERSVNYIIPALRMLPEIQATGDIFFPANWATSLLGSYRSKDAAMLVKRFLTENKDMNPLLLNKVRQAASRLMAKQR